jgi:hypothetical protein
VGRERRDDQGSEERNEPRARDETRDDAHQTDLQQQEPRGRGAAGVARRTRARQQPVLEPHDHHRHPADGRQMRVGEDVGEELAAEHVVDLVEAEQDPQDRGQEEVDERGRHVEREPVRAADAPEDA